MVRHRTVFPRPSIQSFPDLRQADRSLPGLRRPVTTSGKCGTHGWPSHPISSWSSSSRGRHGCDGQSSQSLAWAPLPRRLSRCSRSGSLDVLQIHGSTAMNPDRRQPWPLAIVGQKSAGHGLLPQRRSHGPAAALAAAAKGLDRSAENLLAQAPGPADDAIRGSSLDPDAARGQPA